MMTRKVESLGADRVAVSGAICEAKWSTVESFARSTAGSGRLQSQSEDITQTVFQRFDRLLARGGFADLSLKNWEEPNQRLRVQAWLFGTTLFVVMEFRRRVRRVADIIGIDDVLHTQLPTVTDLTPFQKLLLEEARQCCSSDELEVVDLRVQGLTRREIANQTGLTAATVRSRLAAAQQRMQAYLAADGDGLPLT